MTLNLGEKQFKVSEIVAAIEENGFDHLRGKWVQMDGNKIRGGCVLMQGALNLGVMPDHLDDDSPLNFLYDHAADEEDDVLSAWENDRSGTLVRELNQFPNISTKYAARYAEGCGSSIVEWNDRVLDVGIPKYVLPTYEDVVKMVKDILAPYMDFVVTLKTVDFSQWEMKSSPA